MGEYYQNAVVTIAASSSPSASSGIFISRPKIALLKEVPFRGTDGVSYPIIGQTRDMILHPRSIHGFAPVSNRGWPSHPRQLPRLDPRISRRSEKGSRGLLAATCPSLL